MDDTPFLVRHWRLLMISMLAIAAIQSVISWKMGLHKRLGVTNEDALLGAGLVVGHVTIIGGAVLVLWLLADAITSMPGW